MKFKKKLNIVAIIPIKKKSTRVPNKNFKIVNGKPLYRYLLDRLHKTNFNKIYIDTDSKEIKKFAINSGFNVIDRLPSLSKNSANGNHLLNYHASIIDADFYFQLFITSPFLRTKTINDCIKILKNQKNIDSILTCNSLYSWYWFNNKPVNYNPKILPRSQDAKPVVVETTGLYGIKRSALLKSKSRIGKTPFFYEVSREESIDLDNIEDFDYLEYILKKNKN